MAVSKPRHTMTGEHTYDGILFPHNYTKEVLDRIKYKFELRNDDVLVVTYPKAGTTWIQEIVWLLMNQVDIEKARQAIQGDRSPYLEFGMPGGEHVIDRVDKLDSPRVFKSHLPFEFFSRELKTRSKKTKVIVGVRNVKDVLVSLYHFYRMNGTLGHFSGSFSEFFVLFRDKHLMFGDWFDHVLSYWNNQHEFNFFLLKYEDLHKDFNETVKQLAAFLDQEISDDQLKAIAEHVSFDKMKVNDRVNKTDYKMLKQEISPFMRKGKVGDWRNYFTDEMNEYVDEMYKLKIEGTGLEFDFEI